MRLLKMRGTATLSRAGHVEEDSDWATDLLQTDDAGGHGGEALGQPVGPHGGQQNTPLQLPVRHQGQAAAGALSLRQVPAVAGAGLGASGAGGGAVCPGLVFI